MVCSKNKLGYLQIKEIALVEQPLCGNLINKDTQLVIGVLHNGVFLYDIKDDYTSP